MGHSQRDQPEHRRVAWKIPLGEYPELAAQGFPTTGSENYGGPVVTAGGLVFIAATNFDRKCSARSTRHRSAALGSRAAVFRQRHALDIRGQWSAIRRRPGGRRQGRPGTPLESGGVYVAFALAR